MITFRFTGPAPTTFTDGGVGEVGPGVEFVVPDEHAIAYALHGHCECLDPAALAVLIDALPEQARAGLEALADAAHAATQAAGQPADGARKTKPKNISDPVIPAT